MFMEGAFKHYCGIVYSSGKCLGEQKLAVNCIRYHKPLGLYSRHYTYLDH